MSQDTKRLITGMLLALGIIIAWNQFLRWKYPNWRPGDQAQTTQPATAPATTQVSSATTTRATAQGDVTTAPAPAVSPWRAKGDAAAEPVTVGSIKNNDPAFAMGIRADARGAAIDEVQLNDFVQSAENRSRRYVFQEPYKVDGALRPETRSLLTRSVWIDGNSVDVSNRDWKLESCDAGSARYSIDIYNGETATARLVKTFVVSPRSEAADKPRGFQVNVIHRVENLTDRPLSVRLVLNGPTTPPRELERQPDQNVILGYWNDGAIRIAAHMIASEFGQNATAKDYTKSDKGEPAVWAGTQSAYFNAIVRPVPFDNAARNADWLAQVGADLINPSSKPEDHHVVLKLETTTVTVPPKGAQDFNFEVFLGPKGRKTLDSDYYAALPRMYDRTLVISSGACAVCTWPWLINLLVGLLGFFKMITHDWGLAIILLVLVVRALLHPVTKASQVNMVHMQKLGPELEKLKKKYADQPEALAKAQMEFYKQQGVVKPFLGCLPMFLQMPIWICLWSALQSTFELRAEPFLYGLTWIDDLAKPDYLIRFKQPVQFLFFTITGINILPILMGVVFYLQTKLQPKPPTMTAEQESQQKMMTWMSTLLFPLFLYSGPSGLNIYILTSTAFGIVESKVIRDHIKQREALLAAQGPTIVDAPLPDKDKKKGAKEAPRKKSWMERLQEKAEELRKQAEKRK